MISWRTIFTSSVVGLVLQFFVFEVFTQKWFRQLFFPTPEGFGGYPSAGIALASVFVFFVVPICTLGVAVWVYRHAHNNKWKHVIISTLLTALPAEVFLLPELLSFIT